MTVPVLTQKDFFKLLKDNGWEIVGFEYWDTYNTVLAEKDGDAIPIQVLPKYFYPVVVKTCELLGIKPPEDHKTCYDQQMKL